jgi:hypothetical protein
MDRRVSPLKGAGVDADSPEVTQVCLGVSTGIGVVSGHHPYLPSGHDTSRTARLKCAGTQPCTYHIHALPVEHVPAVWPTN